MGSGQKGKRINRGLENAEILCVQVGLDSPYPYRVRLHHVKSRCKTKGSAIRDSDEGGAHSNLSKQEESPGAIPAKTIGLALVGKLGNFYIGNLGKNSFMTRK